MSANNEIRPEEELLLCCARTSMDSAIDGRVRGLLRAELDWKYLIEAAANHGVKPLLCHNLSNHYQESIPKSVLDQLQRYFQAHALNNLFLSRELVKLLSLLAKNGISAIPWKGPVLSVTAYGNVALRQFGDLDILVHEQDAFRSKDLLLNAGYRLFYQDKSAEDVEAFHALRQVYEMVRADDRVTVELHWAITSQTFYFPLDPGSLWEHAETASLEGTPVRNLSTEDLLIVLCVHGAKHHWGKLMWICDIAELLRAYAQTINWMHLRNRARALGGWRMVCLGVLLARDLVGANLPSQILHAMRAEPKVAFLTADVRSSLFTGGTLMAVERPAFYTQLRERPQDRLRCRLYLAYRLLGPRAQGWTLRLLHSGRSFLHLLQGRRRAVNRHSTNRV
jgi:hypothetical protein